MTRYLGPKTDSADLATQGDFTLTTKGDILTRSTSGLVRLQVGTNGHVLTADSAEASGLKWAAVSGGGGSVTPEDDQIILAGQVFG